MAHDDGEAEGAIGKAKEALYMVILEGMTVEEIMEIRRLVKMALLDLRSMTSDRKSYAETIKRLAAVIEMINRMEVAARAHQATLHPSHATRSASRRP